MSTQKVAISQFDGTSKVLKIDVGSGVGEIFSSDEIPEDDISFGLFDIYEVNEKSNFIALLATGDGPLLFFNEIKYRPELGKTKVSIKDDNQTSHFLILHEGSPVFGLFYERKFGIGLHPYNRERDDIDFYYWLKTKVINPKFYEVYTKKYTVIE